MATPPFITDPTPPCRGNLVVNDTDIKIKVCKLRFHAPFLAAQETVDLLEAEHPNISLSGVTTIVRNALEHGGVTAEIHHNAESNGLGVATDQNVRICQLWFQYPYKTTRQIFDELVHNDLTLTPQKVATTLQRALRHGLVTVRLNYPRELVELLTLEMELVRAFPSLTVAKVCRADARILENLDPEQRRSARHDVIMRLAPLVAGIAEAFIKHRAEKYPGQDTIVAVGWGTTLVWLLRHLAASPRPSFGPTLQFVPMVGLMGRPQKLGFDAHSLATKLAELYSGMAWVLACPALLGRKQAHFAEGFPEVKDALDMLEKAHLVISSVARVAKGGVDDAQLSNDAKVNAALLQSENWQQVLGRICLAFFRDHGLPIPLTHHRAIGMDLVRLREIALEEDRIALTLSGGDPARVPATFAALEGCLISHFLTDEFTARALLEAKRTGRP